MDRPRAAPGGGWSADALTPEQVEVPGLSPLTIRRVVVTRPDLQALARLLANFAGRKRGGAVMRCAVRVEIDVLLVVQNTIIADRILIVVLIKVTGVIW